MRARYGADLQRAHHLLTQACRCNLTALTKPMTDIPTLWQTNSLACRWCCKLTIIEWVDRQIRRLQDEWQKSDRTISTCYRSASHTLQSMHTWLQSMYTTTLRKECKTCGDWYLPMWHQTTKLDVHPSSCINWQIRNPSIEQSRISWCQHPYSGMDVHCHVANWEWQLPYMLSLWSRM